MSYYDLHDIVDGFTSAEYVVSENNIERDFSMHLVSAEVLHLLSRDCRCAILRKSILMTTEC